MGRGRRAGAPTRVHRALVLASADSRDDRIVTLLVEDLGRLSAVARNARKSTRRFGGHIDPLTLTEVALRTRPDWDLARLDSASSQQAFAVVKADLVRLALALTMSEVILSIVAEHDHDPALWGLTLKAWEHLNDPRQRASEDLLLLFELRAMQITGFLPELVDLQGLDDDGRTVLQGWLEGRWQALTPGQRPRVARALEALLEEVSGRALKSRAFLDESLASRK